MLSYHRPITTLKPCASAAGSIAPDTLQGVSWIAPSTCAYVLTTVVFLLVSVFLSWGAREIVSVLPMCLKKETKREGKSDWEESQCVDPIASRVC